MAVEAMTEREAAIFHNVQAILHFGVCDDLLNHLIPVPKRTFQERA